MSLIHHSVLLNRAQNSIGIGILPPALKTNLVAWWKLDEVDGVRLNSVNPTQFIFSPNGSVTSTVGKINLAASPSSSGSFLTTPHDALLSMNGDFSIQLWAKFPNWSNFQSYYLVRKSLRTNLPGSTDYEISVDNNSLSVYDFNAGGVLFSKSFSPNSTFFNGTSWFHFVITYSATTQRVKCYIDGIDIIPTSFKQAALVGVNTPLTIGSNTSTGGSVLLDETAIWRRTLSQAEVSQLYNGGAGLTY
jgi:Concanavalin A-like lectin/glucanases superfamily